MATINDIYFDGDHFLVKDALVYESANWVRDDKAAVPNPIQRKLAPGECIFDLDGVTKIQMELIPKSLEAWGMLFEAHQSSKTGMHIHFLTDITNHGSKKRLVKLMAQRVEKEFGVTNDSMPMSHGHIRMEGSIHPTKKEVKKLVYSNVTPINKVNYIPPEILKRITFGTDDEPVAPKKDINSPPGCLKYILSNRFTDGRKRLLFVVASWYKDILSDTDAITKTLEWAKSQGLTTSRSKIAATISSTNGTVGCTYRHAILEELGHQVTCKK